MSRLLFFLACLALAPVLRADETARRVLAEVNLARTQPRAYARIVASTAPHCPATAEAVRFLERAAARPALAHSDGLARAARSHVAAQGRTGARGHARSFARIARHGQWCGAVGENIDYGGGDPRAIVVRLIVDRGTLGRGHRANLFHKNYRVAGIATGPHARHGTMCVMDFAGGFIGKGERFAVR